MKVEVEKHSTNGRRGKYHGSQSIESGDCEFFDFLKVGQVMVIASSAGLEATIYAKGEGIMAQRFALDADDYEQEALDEEPFEVGSQAITLEVGTELLLSSKFGKRSGREMWMWIECDDDDRNFGLELIPDPPQLVAV